MKKIIAAALSLCIIGGSVPAVQNYAPESCITANAANIAEVTQDGLTYRLYRDHVELKSCDESASGAISIPGKVRGMPVTSIGSKAFYYCNSITSIKIPDSVTTIGDEAFRGCNTLTSINIPNSITCINKYTFANCNRLKWITIPDSVTSIGKTAFGSCYDLTSIKIPDSVTSIGDWAFSNSGLKSISIPDSVTSIGEYTFYGCFDLTSINIPYSVTSIGGNAICGCDSLTSITIPESVISIDKYAFSVCKNLKSITILNPDCDIYPDSSTISNDYTVEKNGTYETIYNYNGTIFGYDNSTAQTYAEECGYKFESLGASQKYKDLGKVNDDTKITVADAADVLRECASLAKGVRTFKYEKKRNADLDFNDKVTVTDASLILNYSAYLAKGTGEKLSCKDYLASKNIKPENE